MKIDDYQEVKEFIKAVNEIPSCLCNKSEEPNYKILLAKWNEDIKQRIDKNWLYKLEEIKYPLTWSGVKNYIYYRQKRKWIPCTICVDEVKKLQADELKKRQEEVYQKWLKMRKNRN